MKTIKISDEAYEALKTLGVPIKLLPEETPVESQEQKMEAFILEMWQDMTTELKPDYPNSVFYIKNGEIIMEEENGIMWCIYEKIWSVFYDRFGLNYQQTQDFLKSMLEKHLKKGEVRPLTTRAMPCPGWKNTSKKER
jgi:hypothetical protein